MWRILFIWSLSIKGHLWDRTGKSIHEKHAIQDMIFAVSFFADASPGELEQDIDESDVYLDSFISGVREQKVNSSPLLWGKWIRVSADVSLIKYLMAKVVDNNRKKNIGQKSSLSSTVGGGPVHAPKSLKSSLELQPIWSPPHFIFSRHSLLNVADMSSSTWVQSDINWYQVH